MPSCRNQSIDLSANQLTGFYKMATLAFNEATLGAVLRDNPKSRSFFVLDIYWICKGIRRIISGTWWKCKIENVHGTNITGSLFRYPACFYYAFIFVFYLALQRVYETIYFIRVSWVGNQSQVFAHRASLYISGSRRESTIADETKRGLRTCQKHCGKHVCKTWRKYQGLIKCILGIVSIFSLLKIN